ncbi:rhodanese-like domain-containing protein [Novosphingobium rosa]|jgi:rhodanese-related sulfurtransferase|uniref:rhodanese-like domain-containing protein n=1 Tax=Novosphingobium rosa TaxID=76978 RepID=UPI0008326B51|nr:rhodanese-like domain-containing protein [Novosphingobium rosa]
MIFGIGKTRKHHEIGASSLHGMITANQVVIVDVREPDEFAAGHIPGAINMPLSTFLPAALPAHPGKVVVLNCQGGKRSGMALDRCAAVGSAVDTHLFGGFGAWVAAGLPVAR